MQTMRLARLGLPALFALAFLTGCEPARLVVRTETIEMPVRQLVKLAPELTEPCEMPEKPVPACSESGKPVLCNRQLVEWRDATQSALDDCAARMGQIRDTEAKAGAK